MKSLISKTTKYTNLLQRFLKYSYVGVGTFIFDLFLIYTFKGFTTLPDALIIGISFFLSVTTNFFISYHWVFKHTKQSKTAGYFHFLGIALFGLLIIIPGTLFLEQTLHSNVYVSRIIVGAIAGITSFLLNNFFNFKMQN